LASSKVKERDFVTPKARLEGRKETATAVMNNNRIGERINYSSQSHTLPTNDPHSREGLSRSTKAKGLPNMTHGAFIDIPWSYVRLQCT
jgi:hypothetical protein